MHVFIKDYKKNELNVVTQAGNLVSVCNLFEVGKVVLPMNLNEEYETRVLIHPVGNHKYITDFYITMSQLADPSALTRRFYNNMIIFSSYWTDCVQEYIQQEVAEALKKGNYIYHTGIIGWQNIPNVPKKEFILDELNHNGIKIQYYDSNLLFKKGTQEKQIDFIINQVIPHKETRLAMVLGLSSVVASYLEQFKSIGTLVINVCGKSSTGKSTIAELSASFFANPETSNYGLVRTFNATKNFIFAMSEGRCGIPIILDDANTNSSEHNKSDLIYQFVMSEPKGRCLSNGTAQQKRNGWSGIVLLTSESPFLNSEKISTGAKARCITLDSIPWTVSADHSEKIKFGVRDNYGHIGFDFAKYVASVEVQLLLDKHNQYSDLIYSKMKFRDSLSRRISSKLAVIALTAEFIKAYNPQFNIDIDETIDQLVEAEQKSVDTRDISSAAFELLVGYIYQKKSHFCTYVKREHGEQFVNCTKESSGDTYGMYYYNRDTRESYIYILKSIFDKFLYEYGITEGSTILQDWKSKRINNSRRWA